MTDQPAGEATDSDTRAYNGYWCAHCRCQVHPNRVDTWGADKNHRTCGKPVAYLALVVMPFRALASEPAQAGKGVEHIARALCDLCNEVKHDDGRVWTQ